MENLNEIKNEEIVEEVAETVEEVVEEVIEEPQEEIVYDEVPEEKPAKKSATGLVVAIIIMAIAILGLLAYVVCDIIAEKKASVLGADSLIEIYEANSYAKEKMDKDVEKNKDKYTELYNNLGYANVSGMTIKDFCEKQGVDFETLRYQYNLPDTLTEDCYFDVVQYLMPISANIDIETLKTQFGVSEVEVDGKKYPVTADMPFGLVYDEITLFKLVGESGFDSVKEEYGFGDEVTEETKMKEVRAKMEKKDMENRIEEEKAEAEAKAQEEALKEELEAATETEETPAE